MIALILSLIVLPHTVQAQSIDTTTPTVGFTGDTTTPTVGFTGDTTIELSEGATVAITVSAAHLSSDTTCSLIRHPLKVSVNA